MTTYQNALVLQGGGALGAYELGVIRRLFEVPNFSLDVVGGVSIGAINAAVLVGAKGDPVQTLTALWDDFAVSAPALLPDQAESYLALLGNRSFYRPRLDYWALPRWTYTYDTTPLRQTLTRYMDVERLGQSPTALAVMAVNVQQGSIEVFDNRTPGKPLTLDPIVASGSLPPGFPMTQIGDQWYWDGGLFNNTPLAPVIEQLNPDPTVKKRLFVVKLFPNAGQLPQNMMEVADRMLELLFASKLTNDLKTMTRINDYVTLVRAIDEVLNTIDDTQADCIRQLPGYRRLQQYMIVEQILTIENHDPEIVCGPFDFSQKKLQQRMAAGYRDADAALWSMIEQDVVQTG